MSLKITIIYFLIANIITFLAFGIDKSKAKRQRYRISERRLIVLAAIGGALGAFIAMYLFHHKTRKTTFRFGIPIILTIQLIAIFYMYRI